MTVCAGVMIKTIVRWWNSDNIRHSWNAINVSNGLLLFRDFNHYHDLGRSKRSLFPFIGQAFSWPIGLDNNEDVEERRLQMSELRQGQKKIIHVVKKSLTLINITRQAVS